MAMSSQTPHDLPKATYAPRPPRQAKPPFWMIAGFLVAIIGTWLPLAIAARSRVATSSSPKIQLVQDMYIQPKSRPQGVSEVFADGRAMRLPIAGTVARGQLDEDDHYFRGFKAAPDGSPVLQDGKPEFFEGYPAEIQVDMDLLKRGQQRFNIYCAVCHGEAGGGDGPIHRRVTELLEAGTSGISWVPPRSLHEDPVRDQPNGKIYNTINVGIRNMPPYGPQIPVKDRWAIVAYVRALELSQGLPVGSVPPDKLNQLK